MAQSSNTLPEGVPAVIEAKRLAVFGIKGRAEAVGVALFDLGWPRRAIIDRLQLRFEFYLDAGGSYRDHNGDPVTVDENTLEACFGDDPGYKWFSDFPKQCSEKGLKKAPSKKIQKRLQLLDLALRTPRLGEAI